MLILFWDSPGEKNIVHNVLSLLHILSTYFTWSHILFSLFGGLRFLKEIGKCLSFMINYARIQKKRKLKPTLTCLKVIFFRQKLYTLNIIRLQLLFRRVMLQQSCVMQVWTSTCFRIFFSRFPIYKNVTFVLPNFLVVNKFELLDYKVNMGA